VGLFAGDARAGCGDYVVILATTERGITPAHGHDNKPPAAPCHGPSCNRQAPPAMPPAPPAPTSEPQTQFDAITASTPWPDPARPAHAATQPPVRPIHFAASLFRPPRFAFAA